MDEELGAEEIERRRPRWQVWKADSGQWWASVRKNLTSAQISVGCVPHLSAWSSEELDELLAEDDAKILPRTADVRQAPMRARVWGTTPEYVELALFKAGDGGSRTTWHFTEIERLQEPTRPIQMDDPDAIATDQGYGWAYAVYPLHGTPHG